MRILYVINSGNPGGLEQYTLDLVNGLSEKGHKVFVWCAPGDIVSWFVDAGANVTIRQIKGEIDIGFIAALTKFIKLNEIDVVQSGELKSGIHAMIAAKLAGVKGIVTHIHTPMSLWHVTSTWKRIYTRIEIIIYSLMVNLLSNIEIALTEEGKGIKVKEWISASKLKVIYNGFDHKKLDIPFTEREIFKSEILKKYNIPEDKIVIGFVSRLTIEKGHEVLIRAFADLPEDVQQKCIVLLGGGGALENKINRLSEDLNIQDKVIITGIFDASEWKKLYSIFDIFVFPTLAEGFGYVLLEGMYMGIPVFASNLNVLKEVGGDTVHFFESGNYKDLSNKLSEFLQTYNRMNQNFETQAKKRAATVFSMQAFLSNYEHLYLSILEKNK